MSMSKLISEVIEVLSVNRCYRQNILQNFVISRMLSVFQKIYTLKLRKYLPSFKKKNMMPNIFIQLDSALLLKKVKNILNY